MAGSVPKTAAAPKEHLLLEIVRSLLGLTLSDKLKFAVKTSLAMMLAYLIPFSQGWAQAQTAVITIMLIAVAGPVTESISKGLLRVIGTVIGAFIGMTLIALFPQDRELYLMILSLFVTFTLYLTRAYKGDNTIFMLTAVTMMTVFQNGEVDDVFLYGIDKTFMTIFGIALYTFIGVFLWPVKSKDQTLSAIDTLIDAQAELYRHRDNKTEVREEKLMGLQEKEKQLENAVVASVSDGESLSREQKNTLLVNAKKINELLMLLSFHDEAHYSKNYKEYIANYEDADREISLLFDALKEAVKTAKNESVNNEKNIHIPKKWEADVKLESIQSLSHIDRASLTASTLELGKLHESLRQMAEKFNAVISPYPTLFPLTKKANPSKFNWFDPEDMKGALISFFIFWTTTFFWIVVNPPAGFLVVTLATALSVITTFSPVKPSMLIIVFTFSFLFAAAMYVLVLPHIVTGWELGLFIFVYAFIGFYFIPPMISIFFLLGMAVLGLNNPMYYDFNLFLLILFVFYLFLFVLLVFYYVPFSTKPEVLFLTLKQRFFNLSSDLLQRSTAMVKHKETVQGALLAHYSERQLFNTVKKMQLWAAKIDVKYFNDIDTKTLLAFTKNCEIFSYLLLMMYRRDKKMADNPLIQDFYKAQEKNMLSQLLKEYSRGKTVAEVDAFWHNEPLILEKIESLLKRFLSSVEADQYRQSDIIAFYENIALRRNVWIAFFKCQEQMRTLDFRTLQESRF